MDSLACWQVIAGTRFMTLTRLGNQRLVFAVANQDQWITERAARQRGREHVMHRAGIRAALAVEQQRVRREAAREIQVVAREHHRAPRLASPRGERFETIDLMMQIE